MWGAWLYKDVRSGVRCAVVRIATESSVESCHCDLSPVMQIQYDFRSVRVAAISYNQDVSRGTTATLAATADAAGSSLAPRLHTCQIPQTSPPQCGRATERSPQPRILPILLVAYPQSLQSLMISPSWSPPFWPACPLNFATKSTSWSFAGLSRVAFCSPPAHQSCPPKAPHRHRHRWPRPAARENLV